MKGESAAGNCKKRAAFEKEESVPTRVLKFAVCLFLAYSAMFF